MKKFVLKNWYKLGILAFLLYIFFQKDLSFEINLNAPTQTKEEIPQQMPPNYNPIKKEREKYTELKPATSIADNSSGSIDRFDLSPFSSSPKTINLLADLSRVDQDCKIKYLKRFSQVAVSERKKFGIPSSIILANALLQSASGKRDMAKKGNNQFAIPCESNWRGEKGNYSNGCYRHYENAWSSFRDHSIYITSGKFKSLRQLSHTDYKSWAEGLENAGYANSEGLAQNLVQVIEQYALFELDKK